MKNLTTLIPFLLATPALAHGGAHMHPHGIDLGAALLVGLVALGGVFLMARK